MLMPAKLCTWQDKGWFPILYLGMCKIKLGLPLCLLLSCLFYKWASDLVCSGWNGWRSSNLARASACMPTCWQASVCGTHQLVCTSSAVAQTSGGNCSTPTPRASTITMPPPNAPSGTAHMDATSSPLPSSRHWSRTQTHFLLLRWSVDRLTAALLAAPSAPHRHKSRRIKQHPEKKERGKRETREKREQTKMAQKDLTPAQNIQTQ